MVNCKFSAPRVHHKKNHVAYKPCRNKQNKKVGKPYESRRGASCSIKDFIEESNIKELNA